MHAISLAVESTSVMVDKCREYKVEYLPSPRRLRATFVRYPSISFFYTLVLLHSFEKTWLAAFLEIAFRLLYKMRLLTTSLLIALSYRVAAHGIVTKIIVAGTKTYQGYSPDFQYQPTPPAVIGWTAPLTQDRGPVDSDSYTNPDIICHRGATPGKVSAQVAAGDTVSLQWTPWPDSHHGPMLDYLADCGADCTTVDKTKLSFFKIDGVGMTNTAGVRLILCSFSRV